MRKSIFFLLTILISVTSVTAQKIISDCTIEYQIRILGANNLDGSAATSNAVKTIYVNGKMFRSDLQSSSFDQTTFVNGVDGSVVILREIGSNKYMSRFDEEQWKKQNAKYEGAKVQLLNETRLILGLTCKKAVVSLKDGTTVNVFYSNDISISVEENPFQFKAIPGLVLEYSTRAENSENIITYTATKISYDPVPASKFNIPTSGYRILQ